MRITICDDDIEILNFLEGEIKQLFGKNFTILRYNDVQEMLGDWQNPKKHTEIVIMDIKFQDSSGVDVAKQIHELYGMGIKIIFMTGYPQHAPEIFRAHPTFLLMKPIAREFLQEAIMKAETLIKEENQKAVYVSFRECTRKIKAIDIFYVESIRKKVIINYVDGKEEAILKLSDVEKQLPEYFLRIHQSFLVNMHFIKTISAYQMEMSDGTQFPISRSRSKYAKERFLDFLSTVN